MAVGGIGCLVIIAIILLGGGFVWYKFGPQIQEKIGEFQKDPERAAATVILQVNPDIEVIRIDDTARTVTFKVKSTGEVITATFAAIGKSRITYINGKTEIHDLDRVPTDSAATPATDSVTPAPTPTPESVIPPAATVPAAPTGTQQ